MLCLGRRVRYYLTHMNTEPRPSSEERERRKSEEALRATQKAIAKLWRIYDKVRGYPESEKNVERLRRAIDRLHEEPFSPIASWKSAEEAWLDQQLQAGIIEREEYYYLLDGITSEERDDAGEAWSRHLRAAIVEQEVEVPLPARYGQDPNGPTPYERLASALSVLKDNPREMMGDVWIDRAVRLGLIPRAEATRYLDIFLSVRDKAEVLRDEEWHRRRAQAGL